MKYGKMVKGIFLSRPNRFIAKIEIDGKEETVHVKNTGRCRELLPKGAEVWCEKAANPSRKTKFDLITVRKGDRLINMDSQAPNTAAGEWLSSGGLGEISDLKPLPIRPMACRSITSRQERTQSPQRIHFAVLRSMKAFSSYVYVCGISPSQRSG